jgi:hypothetical protein
MQILKFGGCALTFLLLATAACADVTTIGAYAARFDAQGRLLPWTPWPDAIEREMRYYRQSPWDHGYPRFVTETFLLDDWIPDPHRTDTIPATQNGMGILSYVKWAHWRHDPEALDTARKMADYLIRETLTPDTGEYPRFPHSTGRRDRFPQSSDSGSQSDRPFEIEPDKGGIVGYALLTLDEATHHADYTDEALHIARVLASHQRAGDPTHSPWPFRVDHRNGAERGNVSGNMTFILRLYDGLLERGFVEFAKPRRDLWNWIRRYQIPSARSDGKLFAQFFEDHDSPVNRTAWAPLNLARYLLERRTRLDPNWRDDAGTLIAFVRREFTHREAGITVCHEQDEDHDAWGGVNSTYGAVLAMYAKATGSARLEAEAREAITFTLYAIDDDGRPRDLPKHPIPGGWQEDAHTDVIHNVVDAIQALGPD